MDIQFIEQEHRDNIFKIMELCNIDMNQAFNLYNNNGCNVQNAVQAKFNAFNETPFNFKEQSKTNIKTSQNMKRNNTNQKISFNEDDYQNYKIFKQTNQNFNTRYQVRKKQGFISGLLSKFTSSSNQNNFKKKLEQYLSVRVNVSFQSGNLSEALQNIWKNNSDFPLLVHIVDFDDKSQREKVKSLYRDQVLVRKFKEQFKNYGIVAKDYQLQPFLKEFIDLKNDVNCFIAFRINVMDQICLVSKISFGSLSTSQLSKKFGLVKNNCITYEMQQHHLKNRYKQELRGNYDYQKPMSIADQRKLKQDRMLRKKQQQEFYASMQPKNNLQKQQKPTTITNNSLNQHLATQQVKKQQPPKKDTKKQFQNRKKIRDNLKIYQESEQDIISIKLRLPSSQSLKVHVHSNQTAQYLYDYIYSRQQDLGFQNDAQSRIFDIIQPYDKINLSERKRQILGKIFQGETMLSLVVNQASK